MKKIPFSGILMGIFLLAGGMACVSGSGKSERSTTLQSENNPPTMNENVMSFCSKGNFVEVTFSLSPMIFRVSTENDDFAEIVGNLARAFKEKRPVKYATTGNELTSVAIQ